MLKTLLLRNFRNYSEQLITFSPKKNIFFGENAQGKTNLIEAISLITTGRSHRTFNLSECIGHNKDYFYLEAVFENDAITHTIKLYYDKTKKNLQINKDSYTTFSPLIGLYPSVIHTPYDLYLITGAPSLRRKLFDLHLSQQDKSYLKELVFYYQAKKQRDCLLKKKKKDSIDCFEEKMDQFASLIIEKRKQIVLDLKPLFCEYAKAFLVDKDLQIDYQPSVTALLEALEKNREKEFILGNTLYGPHRDDFSFVIDHKSARTFASEGQKRACILALRLAEYQKLKSQHKKILFCIDDMVTHFDPQRQKTLQSVLNDLDQVFISLPDPNPILEEEGKKFVIQEGTVYVFQENLLK